MIINLDFFLIFILAHLIGDFVLQTDKLAKLKSISFKGVIIHCGVVTLVQLLMLGVFGLNGLIAAVICGLIHLFVDFYKKKLNSYFSRFQFVFFIIDQAVHIAVILLLTKMFSGQSNVFLGYLGFVRLAIGFIILAYASTVSVKILIKDLKLSEDKWFFFEKNERMLDALFAIIFCAAWFLPLLWSIVVIAACLLIYQQIQKSKYNYKLGAIAAKCSIFILSGLLVYLFTKGIIWQTVL